MIVNYRSIEHVRFTTRLEPEEVKSLVKRCSCRGCFLVHMKVLDQLRELKNAEPAGSC